MLTTTIASRTTGKRAQDIAAAVRALIEQSELAPGHKLPTVRSLAEAVDVNRNTVVSAYRTLASAGLVEARGRHGTFVAGTSRIAEDGYTETSLRDVAAGNPDPSLIPNLGPALRGLSAEPVMYGESVIDPGLEAWARDWLADDLADRPEVALTITGGAFDAIERLLAQALTRDDAVALEDPCFLATIRTARLSGYRPIAVPVDAEGMTADGLRRALDAGARAVVCTPRAQNPTGASLSEKRAAELRGVLERFPHVLVIEDDHFSLLASEPYRSPAGPSHRRWALIRSVSKFLGPDMSLAILASDPDTASRLALRLSPGTTWVSHLLQRLTHAQLASADARRAVASAAAHYRERNARLRAALAEKGLTVPPGEGLSLWVPVATDSATATARLREAGWLARADSEFSLANADAHAADAPEGASAPGHVRVTAHRLTDEDIDALAQAIADAGGAP